MMGTKARLFTPISVLSLEELVPADHFYRHVDRVLDLSFVRELVQDRYAGMGRPSVDPVVFFRLQLVMFFEGIRSERQLVRLAADRLSVRWYLGYNLNEALPDHSRLTRIRAGYGLDVFRRFFEAIVEQCQQAGLVWGRELYFDATQVQATAALDSLTPRFAVEAPEAREALQAQPTKQSVEAHLAALFPDEPTQRQPPTLVPVSLPTLLREDLEAANAARHDWIAQAGRQQRAVHGVYRRTADFRISATDPDATPMRLKGGGTHLGYQTHHVVDGGKKRIILEVWLAPGEVMENQPMLDLLWHALPLASAAAAGDGRYHLRDGGEYRRHRAGADPRLHAPARLGEAHPLLRRRAVSLRSGSRWVCLPQGGAPAAGDPSVYRTREAVSGQCRHLQRLPAQGAMHPERARAPTDAPFRRAVSGPCTCLPPDRGRTAAHTQAACVGATTRVRNARLECACGAQ